MQVDQATHLPIAAVISSIIFFSTLAALLYGARSKKHHNSTGVRITIILFMFYLSIICSIQAATGVKIRHYMDWDGNWEKTTFTISTLERIVDGIGGMVIFACALFDVAKLIKKRGKP